MTGQDLVNDLFVLLYRDLIDVDDEGRFWVTPLGLAMWGPESSAKLTRFRAGACARGAAAGTPGGPTGGDAAARHRPVPETAL